VGSTRAFTAARWLALLGASWLAATGTASALLASLLPAGDQAPLRGAAVGVWLGAWAGAWLIAPTFAYLACREARRLDPRFAVRPWVGALLAGMPLVGTWTSAAVWDELAEAVACRGAGPDAERALVRLSWLTPILTTAGLFLVVQVTFASHLLPRAIGDVVACAAFGAWLAAPAVLRAALYATFARAMKVALPSRVARATRSTSVAA
jgi:hypothetical protein